MRKKIILVVFIILFSFFHNTSILAFSDNEFDFYEVKVPLVIGENITASYRNHVFSLGKIIALPTKTRWPSYTASAWGVEGHVCATAVNAIHMLVSVEEMKGRTLSIIPRETIAPAAGPGASIIVSSKAGSGIFGSWAPTVGTQVFVQKKDSNVLKKLSNDNLPKQGDILFLRTHVIKLPYMLEIENHPGGRITIWEKDGYSFIGRVIKPIAGVGRFEGTLFQRTSALRANHSGVIDISSSPFGKIGGFQIIPIEHAISSKEMQAAWDMSQWLIIANKNGSSKMAGTFPLFKHALLTGPSEDEKLWDTWSTYGRKSLLLVRLNGGKWQRMDDAIGRNDTALNNVTHLRLYFPFHEEIQKSN